jgi:lipopolysaccharide export system protein LptA
MHHPVKIFAISFACSFALLYLCAGGIWSDRQKSPLTVATAGDEKPVTRLLLGQQRMELYQEHKVEQGHYVNYVPDTRDKEFEIHCAEIAPWSRDELALKRPRFVYYPQKSMHDVPSPSLLEVTAEEGILHRGKPRFDLLRFNREVLMKGFDRVANYTTEGKVMSTLTAQDLEIHLLHRTMKSSKVVHLEHKDVLLLQGEGFDGDVRQEHLVLHKNVVVTAFSALWQKRNRTLAADRLTSRSKGRTEVSRFRTAETIEVTQDESVEMAGSEARLTCDHIRFWLRRKDKVADNADKDAWEISKIEAHGNVCLVDGANTANSDTLVLENKKNVSEAVMRGNARIHIGDIHSFTILDAESHARLIKSQRKISLKTLDVTASERLVWRREMDQTSQNAREIFDFWGRVDLAQSSHKIPFLRLTCDKRARLILASPAGHEDRREPTWFKAAAAVKINHDKVEATGKTLLWRRLNATTSETLLSGEPRLKLKELAWGEAQNPFDTLGLMDEVKTNATTRAKKEAAPHVEDMVVSAQEPMRLLSEEQERGDNLLRYFADKEVTVVRYRAGSDERVGHVRCRRLQLTAHGASGVLHEQKDAATKQRLEVSQLDASGDVNFSLPEGEGGGDRLLFAQTGTDKTVTLAGKAWTQNEQGQLRGDRFCFDSKSEIFHAVGRPVTMSSKEMAGNGDNLYFYKKEGRLELIGQPARVWQNDEKGAQKHTLVASEINYWRNSGKATAVGKARLTFTADEGQNLRKTQPAANAGKKTGKEKPPARYQLDTEALRARFSQQQKTLDFFSAAGGVHIIKLNPADAAQKQEATGDWLVYRAQKLTLVGKPAVIHYGDNSMTSAQFTFYENEKKAVCEGPAEVVLPNLKSAQSKLTGELDLMRKNEKPASSVGKNKEETANPLRIRCQGQVHFLDASKQILFHKTVQANMAQGNLDCELLQVNLREQEIESLIAHEQVRLTASDNVARADQLYWRATSGIASLTSRRAVELSTREFRLYSPVVWYDIQERHFFTRGQEVLVERLGDKESAVPKNIELYRKK